MTALKEEEAFASIVSTANVKTVCSFCLASNKTVHACKGCHKLHYCDDKCQKSDWVNHKNECRLLSKDESIPGDHIRLTARILLKSKKDLDLKAFNGRTWDSLTDHHKEVRDNNFFKGVDLLMSFLKPVKIINRKQAVRALSKVVTNSVEIYESTYAFHSVGVGVYLGLSIHKHSCIPNSQLIFNGTKAVLHSMEEGTDYSDELTISYSSHEPWFPNRKRTFSKNFLYDCTCPLCTDKNHIFNRMGSSCHVSCCKNAAGILDENGDGPYKCNKCGAPSPLSVEDVEMAEMSVSRHTSLVSTALPCEDMHYFRLTMNIIGVAGQVLSIFNFKLMRMICDAHAIASTKRLHSESKQLHDWKLIVYNYYLHPTSKHLVRCLMYRSCLRQLMDKQDDFDVDIAMNAAVHSFGEEHPVVANFKNLVFDVTGSMKNVAVARDEAKQQKEAGKEVEEEEASDQKEREETDHQDELKEEGGDQGELKEEQEKAGDQEEQKEETGDQEEQEEAGDQEEQKGM